MLLCVVLGLWSFSSTEASMAALWARRPGKVILFFDTSQKLVEILNSFWSVVVKMLIGYIQMNDIFCCKHVIVLSYRPSRSFPLLCHRYPMAMGTLADLEDQEPIPGKENPYTIHLKVSVWICAPTLKRWHFDLKRYLNKITIQI